MQVKPTHLHPFYGFENTPWTVHRLYSGVGGVLGGLWGCEIPSPAANAVGLAGSQSSHTHKWQKAAWRPLVDSRYFNSQNSSCMETISFCSLETGKKKQRHTKHTCNTHIVKSFIAQCVCNSVYFNTREGETSGESKHLESGLKQPHTVNIGNLV